MALPSWSPVSFLYFSRRWSLPKLAILVHQNGRTGWYLRALKDGQIEAGMSLELMAHPFPELSVAWANSVMDARSRRPDDEERLATCSMLFEARRNQLERQFR
jgi:MOSC domain-containing protein YiiM